MVKFGKSLKVSLHNWKAMLSSIFIQLLIFAVLMALCWWAFGGLLSHFLDVMAELDLQSKISAIIDQISSGENSSEMILEEITSMVEQVVQKIKEIPNFAGQVMLSYLLAILLFTVYRMAIGICDVPVVGQINEFMTCNSSRPFFWYFFKKFWLSVRFCFWQSVFASTLDVIILFSVIGGFIALLPLFQGATWIVMCLTFIALYSIRHCYFAFWLPVIVVEANTRPLNALIVAVSKLPAKFFSVFWKFAVVLLVDVCSIVGFVFLQRAFPNVPLFPILSALTSFVLFFVIKNVAIVEYFEMEKKLYFTYKIKLPSVQELNMMKD